MRHATKALSLAAWAAATLAYGRDPIKPGLDVNGHAGIGAVVGSDPTATFYNPANLTGENGFESYSELSLAAIQHSYTHYNYAPFSMNIVAPLIALGGTYALNRDVVLGGVFFPTGANSKLELDGVPIDLTPTDSASARIITGRTGYDAGFGASWRLNRRFTLGGSVIQSYSHNKIEVNVDEAEEPRVLEADVSGLFHRFVFGGRLTEKHWALGLSLGLPSVRRYHGTSRMPALGQTEPYDSQMTEYIPLTLAVGAEMQRQKMIFRGEYAFEQHSAGREIARSGMSELDAQETDLHDTHNLSLSGDYVLNEKTQVGGGVGYFQGRSGTPEFTNQGGKDNLGVSGMRFGDFEGMDRVEIGAVYKKTLPRLHLTGGAFLFSGWKNVPEGHPYQGDYRFLLTAISASARYDF